MLADQPQPWRLLQPGGWMHAKLTLVVLLIGYHHMCGAQVKRFARGENTRSHVFYRWFNEVPVLILLGYRNSGQYSRSKLNWHISMRVLPCRCPLCSNNVCACPWWLRRCS